MDNLRIENSPLLLTKDDEKIKQKAAAGFDEVIQEAIHRINGVEREANRAIADLLQGKAEIHETMIALQKGDISMRLLLAIRNKAIEAYKEIMHMQF